MEEEQFLLSPRKIDYATWCSSLSELIENQEKELEIFTRELENAQERRVEFTSKVLEYAEKLDSMLAPLSVLYGKESEEDTLSSAALLEDYGTIVEIIETRRFLTKEMKNAEYFESCRNEILQNLQMLIISRIDDEKYSGKVRETLNLIEKNRYELENTDPNDGYTYYFTHDMTPCREFVGRTARKLIDANEHESFLSYI